MKRFSIVFCIFSFFILASFLLKPNQQDFENWLFKNYNIICVQQECIEVKGKVNKEGFTELEAAKFVKYTTNNKSFVVFSILENTYTDKQGRETNIKAFGMLKQFFLLKHSVS